MYVPSHFSESRPEVMHDLIRACPLGSMVTVCANRLEANHIPFHLDVSATGSATLLGHVARSNPVWELAKATPEALVIFQGPASYISPRWYPTKLEHGKVVPTWNYVAVHAHGALKFHEETDWIRVQLEKLTHQMESALPNPWGISDAPADYIEKLVRSIVGVEISVERLIGKWKVSQNQPVANRAGVIQALESTDDAEAIEMAKIVKLRSTDDR